MLFFPDGVSSQGSAKVMTFNLANFKGEIIPDSTKSDRASDPFTLECYINKHKLVEIRIYLASKPVKEETFSESDDILMQPGPVNELQSTSKWRKMVDGIDEDEIAVFSSDGDSEDFLSATIPSVAYVENSFPSTATSTVTNASTLNSPLMGTSEESC